jgi:hypothetical protein
MTRRLPFTAASLARAIKGAEKAGKYVAGIRPDGTLLLTDGPVTLAPAGMVTHNGYPPPDAAGDRWGDVEA